MVHGKNSYATTRRPKESELTLFTVPSFVHLSIQLASSVFAQLVGRIKIEMANRFEQGIFHMVLL